MGDFADKYINVVGRVGAQLTGTATDSGSIGYINQCNVYSWFKHKVGINFAWTTNH